MSTGREYKETGFCRGLLNCKSTEPSQGKISLGNIHHTGEADTWLMDVEASGTARVRLKISICIIKRIYETIGHFVTILSSRKLVLEQAYN